MKSLIAGFVKNESGALSFEDGLTVFSLTVGFVAALVLVNSTIAQLFANIFSMLPGAR